MPRSSLIPAPHPQTRRHMASALYFAPALGVASALLLATALHAPALRAQMHRVPKPAQVTRAVAVYEWTGSLDKPTAARLVPVSLFIHGQIEDADVYLARPIPFALDTGDVYSIEKAGQSEGLLDLEIARDVVTHRDLSDDDPIGTWYGYGTFHIPVEAAVKPLHTTANPASIDASNADNSQPHFIRRAPPATTAPSTTANKSTASAPPIPDDEDPERPTLRRRDPDSEHKHHNRHESGSGVLAPSQSLNDDPDRPTLHRGSLEGPAATPPLVGLPPGMHQAVAVSDATQRDPHDFALAWDSPAQQAATLASMEQLARPLATAYAAANHLELTTEAAAKSAAADEALAAGASTSESTSADGQGPPKLERGKPKAYQQTNTPPAPASHTQASTHKRRAHHAAKKALPLTAALVDEQLVPLTLSYGGTPTFVYTAASPITLYGPIYITLVAQRLPTGELQLSLHSVTDAGHLDRTPRLRFVGPVDPDASHRASLLFELRARASRQFALYRLISVDAEQTFVTAPIE